MNGLFLISISVPNDLTRILPVDWPHIWSLHTNTAEPKNDVIIYMSCVCVQSTIAIYDQ